MPRSDASESLPVPVEAREVEVRRGGRFPFASSRGDALVLVHDLPDEQGEQPGDDRDRQRLQARLQPRRHDVTQAGTMKTGVPTSTWSNSHSASGMYMRMQPCEAE